MSNEARIAIMKDEFGHRLTSEAHEEGGWLVWSTDKSVQTLSKFVERAKKRGVRGVFAKPGRVGCLAE